MGLFRTVHLTRPCERCGREHPDFVQFKTDNDRLEEYGLGQIVPPDDALQPGRRWSGAAADRLSDAHFAAQFALNALEDRKLKAAGWPAGRDAIREDVEVYLDEDSRIQVHFPGEDDPCRGS